jgi:hypothetical protein
VGNIVCVHRHFARIYELILANDTHIGRHGTNLLTSYVVVKLSGGIAWSGTVLNPLIRSNRVVSECSDLLIACRLVTREFALVLSTSRLTLTATVVQTVRMNLIVSLIGG